MAQSPAPLEKLVRSDWRLLAICAVVFLASLAFGIAFAHEPFAPRIAHE